MAEYDEFDPFRRGRRPSGQTTVTGAAVPTTTTTPMSVPGTQPDAGDAPPSPAPSAPRPVVTSLAEGDPYKLDPAHGHQYESPKYSFLQLAPQYGRGQETDLLKALQSDPRYGRFWQGWTFDGRGNFVFTGNPSQLAPEWNGETFVDAYEGYGSGGPLKARWGVGEDGSGPRTQSAPAPNPLQQMMDLWFTPPSGNTGVSGYMPGGLPLPSAPLPSGPSSLTLNLPTTQAPPPPTVSGAPTPLALQNPGVTRALQLLALQMPQLFQSGTLTDPLAQQLLSPYGSYGRY